MGLPTDIHTIALQDRLRIRYNRYTINAAAQERLQLAQVALDALPEDQADSIRRQVRTLTRKIRGLGQVEGVALLWAIGKLFKEQPAYYESLLSGHILKHLEGGDEQ
jgi:putative effector of murein hydrolase